MANTVFSGIQPSGIPHLGNYLGAIKAFAPLQMQHECLWCIVDMHAITVWQEPKLLRRQTLELAAALLACGIDHKNHILFHQSAVSAHARLAWIFNCVARIGWLNRMTQFKDKASKDRENFSAGLFIYPALMAADILAYKANLVPVGEDQQQHLEFANDIAQKFNHDYAVSFFSPIQALIPQSAARIMSLRDGTKKMSKSDPSDQSRINLIDTNDQIKFKIQRAKTDSEPLPSDSAGLSNRPEAKNLVSMMGALTGQSLETILSLYGGQSFSSFKKNLTDIIITIIEPIANRISHILAEPDEIDKILTNGAQRAAFRADPIVAEIEYIVGFLSKKPQSIFIKQD